MLKIQREINVFEMGSFHGILEMKILKCSDVLNYFRIV